MPLGPGSSELTPTIADPPRMPARVGTVRLQFDRRASRFGRHDAVVREVGRRLVERLDLIRLDPREIVDIGCGAGGERAALLARYPTAKWTGIDLSLAMLRPQPAGLLRRIAATAGFDVVRERVVASAEALPLADDRVDLLVSNLMLHWHPAPHEVFPEWLRVLRPGGLLLFSCFGPDTLKELRAACLQAGLPARPVPFVDLHDFGDMMVAAGLATPVMDAEVLKLTYPDARALLAEVRALGGNPRDDRAAALPGGRRARALVEALDAQRGADGRVALSFEIAYGHAWKPMAAVRKGAPATVPLERLRASLRRGGDGPSSR